MKSFIFITLLPVLLFFTIQINCQSSLGSYTKEFGESCNAFEQCNYRHWLKCQNGTCACLDSQGMLFTPSPSTFLSFFSSRAFLLEQKSCRARVEAPCKRSHYVDDNSNHIPAPNLDRPQEGSSKQTQLCVPDAYCHPHGTCKCNLNYTLNYKDGTCQKLREFSEMCDKDIECHPDHFLKCRRSICQCDPMLKYDHVMKKCSSPPDGKCTLTTGRKGYLLDNCVRNATCHLGICKCGRGYLKDLKLKECTRDYEYSCSPNLPCVDNYSEEYVCLNSSCVCNQYRNRRFEPVIFDTKLQRCRHPNGSGHFPPGILFTFITLVLSLIL